MSKTGSKTSRPGLWLYCFLAALSLGNYGYWSDKNIYDQSKTKLRLAILAGVIRAMRISIKLLGSLSKDADCDGNENVKKKNRFGLAKHQLWTCFTLFYTFLCRRCTTSTWNWEYISPFCGYRECKTTIFVFFSWTSIRSLHSSWVRQHLTNLTRWNKRDKIWSGANSLFKWRFCSRRRRRCLGFLLILSARAVGKALYFWYKCIDLYTYRNYNLLHIVWNTLSRVLWLYNYILEHHLCSFSFFNAFHTKFFTWKSYLTLDFRGTQRKYSSKPLKHTLHC